MAAKLFSYFAYPVTSDDAVVSGFATTFVNSGFSVRALVEAILKSPQFSSNAAYRARIKSPVEMCIGAFRALGADRFTRDWWVFGRLNDLGQYLFYPPDVGGWTSGRGWINASTMLTRVNMATGIILSLGDNGDTGSGGQPVSALLAGLTTGTQKIDRILALLVDGDIPSDMRSTLIAHADNPQQEPYHTRGLFNTVMALPAYQLN